MADNIAMTDIKLKYASLAEARTTSGLRLILGSYAVPGPWREACKSIFYVKKIAYVPVTSAGKDGTEKELIEWTAQASAPVAIWNDERPRSTWIEQLFLAERLGAEPRLIPADAADRILMFGYANEILGETGFGWSKRLTMIDATVNDQSAAEGARKTWAYLGRKYGYSSEAAKTATARIIEILNLLSARLESQHVKGSRYFIGNQLTALDIYWATFAALLRPMPVELCPMATAFRGVYKEDNPAVLKALTPSLLEHRDFIYREHLELPVVF
jgi:glutathione S-transferase